MKILSLFTYQWWWFHLEWWLPAPDRRPFTFIIRDWYHNVPLPTIVGLGITFYMIGRYTTQISLSVLLGIVLALVTGIILGHIYWGKKWREGEQENPQYLGDGQGLPPKERTLDSK